MADFTIKQGDTLPWLEVTVVPPPGKSPAIPMGSTVAFKMRQKFNPKTTTVTAAGVIDDFDLGKMHYEFNGTTDNSQPGPYEGEFIITKAGGGQLTVPNNGSIEILVEPRIP